MKAVPKIFGRHWREVFPRANSLNALANAVAGRLLTFDPARRSDGEDAIDGDTIAHFVDAHPDGAGFVVNMPFELWHRIQCALGAWHVAHMGSPAPYTLSVNEGGTTVRVGGFVINVLPREYGVTQGRNGKAQKVPLGSSDLTWGKTSDDGFIKYTVHSKDSPLPIDGQKDFRFGFYDKDRQPGKSYMAWATSFRGYALNPFGDVLRPPRRDDRQEYRRPRHEDSKNKSNGQKRRTQRDDSGQFRKRR